MKPSKGFTLVEILLSIVIFALLAGLSIPLYRSFAVHNEGGIAVNIVAQTMRRAQLLSQASHSDQTWGISVQTGQVTLFQGASFGTRNANFDESFSIPNGFLPSGLTEIVFTKLSGEPNTTGMLSFTSPLNEIHSLTINAKGMIQY